MKAQWGELIYMFYVYVCVVCETQGAGGVASPYIVQKWDVPILSTQLR